jgi:hypothetical protein
MTRNGDGVRRRIAFDMETYLALDRLPTKLLASVSGLSTCRLRSCRCATSACGSRIRVRGDC